MYETKLDSYNKHWNNKKKKTKHQIIAIIKSSTSVMLLLRPPHQVQKHDKTSNIIRTLIFYKIKLKYKQFIRK